MAGVGDVVELGRREMLSNGAVRVTRNVTGLFTAQEPACQRKGTNLTNLLCLKLYYRVRHQLSDLRFVVFDLDVSSAQQILLGQLQIWQNWHTSSVSWRSILQ